LLRGAVFQRCKRIEHLERSPTPDGAWDYTADFRPKNQWSRLRCDRPRPVRKRPAPSRARSSNILA
jgi:hypothetical protein